MSVAERFRTAGDRLTATERRIADVALRTPQVVAFGTVAEVADAAGAGTATVVRLATKLGYSGYVELQRDVQEELSGRLRPAAERIQTLGDGAAELSAVLARQLDAERFNIEQTFAALDAEDVARATSMLADNERPVLLLSGAASAGVGAQFAHELRQLRGAVSELAGNQIDVLRTIALADTATVVVAVDLRRYDQWLIDALSAIHECELDVIAVSDSVLSPLAVGAVASFVISADSGGPFDSHVATLALFNLFVADVAHAVRNSAADRLSRLEGVWSRHGALGR